MPRRSQRPPRRFSAPRAALEDRHGETSKTLPGARARDAEPRYRPLRDYAAIGDCHGAALVGRDGSIDWCALGRLDADPVFCRLLDADRGGFWSIRPGGEFQTKRSYLPDSNILSTVFTTADGEVALTDFMPVGRALDAGAHDYVSLNAPAWLVRRVEGLKGSVELIGPLSTVARLRPLSDRALDRGRRRPWRGRAVAVHRSRAAARWRQRQRQAHGARGRLSRSGAGGARAARAPPNERVSELFRITRAFWREWTSLLPLPGPVRSRRSGGARSRSS